MDGKNSYYDTSIGVYEADYDQKDFVSEPIDVLDTTEKRKASDFVYEPGVSCNPPSNKTANRELLKKLYANDIIDVQLESYNRNSAWYLKVRDLLTLIITHPSQKDYPQGYTSQLLECCIYHISWEFACPCIK